MFTTIHSQQTVPNPDKPCYYWHRLTANDPWVPKLVEPATESWPATVQDGIHNPDVSKVGGEWAECPFPEAK